MKYNIGDIGFKTKKDCETYTRNIVNSNGCGRIHKDHKDYSFFENLIKNHPHYDEKIGEGIDYFYIVINPMNKTGLHLMIQRVDGTNVDISWVYCCQFKEHSVDDILTRAMRASIKDYVIAFKQSQILICNICKSDDKPYHEYHTDHNLTSFKKLKDDFLKLTTLSKPIYFNEFKFYELKLFKDEDVEFENTWVSYHNKHCDYQLLCRSCNIKKH